MLVGQTAFHTHHLHVLLTWYNSFVEQSFLQKIQGKFWTRVDSIRIVHDLHQNNAHSSGWHADEHHAWYIWPAYMVGQAEHLHYWILVMESGKSWQQVYHTLSYLHTTSLDLPKAAAVVPKCIHCKNRFVK